ncbi:O-antigen ligase family protein [Marinobacter salexigens]|uniref:O-antigen ligase family protein n=1 Tax=Marinobacter salexigens TaxID=1925763 RepID=UPI00128FF220|nr:O-antigen ligase family protein [Marinobacter salexigens]
MTFVSRLNFSALIYCLIVFLLSLTLSVVCLFSDFFNVESRYDFQRYVLVFVISFLPSIILFVESLRGSCVNNYASIIWLFPTFFVLLYSYINVDRYAIFPLEGLMFALCLMFVALVGVWAKKSQFFFGIVFAVIYSLVVVSFFYSLLTILEYLLIILDGLYPEDMLPFGFGNIRQWSHLATWLIPLLPVSIMVGPLHTFRVWRAIVIITASVWWWLIILSSAHGSFAAQALSFFLILLLYRYKAIRWAQISLVFFFLGACLWFVLSYVFPSMVFGDVSEIQIRVVDGLPARLILWGEAFSMSLTNFPFGMGGQSWLTHEPITEAFVNGEVKNFGAPHSMYLLWASEYGWVFVLTLLFPVFFVFRGIKSCYEIYYDQESPLVYVIVGVVASTFSGLFHSGVSSVLLAPAGMLFGLLVLSMVWALAVSFDVGIPSYKFRSFWVLMSGVAFSLGLFFLSGVIEYKVESDRDRECVEKSGMTGYMPRFWHHGYFPNRTGCQYGMEVPNAMGKRQQMDAY